MAFGIIKADTLTHSTAGSLATNYVVNGSAKAWMQLNGTGTIAIQGSFNTSSVTDNNTGDYQQTYTNSFNNDDYAGLATSRRDSVNKNYGNATMLPTSASSTQVCVGIEDVYGGEAALDSEFVHTAIHGDLA